MKHTMRFLTHNNIFKNCILGFFLVLLLLTPVTQTLEFRTVNAQSPEENNSQPTYIPGATAAEDTVVQGSKTTAAGWNDAEKLRTAADAKDTTLAGKIATAIYQFLGMAILNMASALTDLGGRLLDAALQYLVFGMGAQINNSTFGSTIDTMWTLIRDICNLAFIFGFIYVGIRTILDPDSVDPKRFLSKIIIGALLINFSLFFVKIIIDFSNFTALKIYTAMASESGSISGTITNMLGIVTFYKIDGSTLANLTGGGNFWFFPMAAIFLITTAFVFIAASILLVTRFVGLILIMVFSPILFAATVFPATEKYATDLWHKLFGYAFFAPAYLLLTLVSISLLQGLGIKPPDGTFVNALTHKGVGSFNVILNFAIVIFTMISSLTIAQKLGVAGADAVVTKTKQVIGGATVGLAARAGRGTFGKFASRMADNDNLKDLAAQRGFAGWRARQQLKVYRAGADANFDARGIGGVGGKLGVGEGRKGGYDTVKKEVQEKEEKFAKSLGEVDDTDIFVATRKAEMEHGEKHLEELKDVLSETKRKRDLAQAEIKRVTTEEAKATGAEKDALNERLKQLNIEESKLQEKMDEMKPIVETQEKENKGAKLKYESEKQRRIIGSTFNTVSQDVKDAKAKVEGYDGQGGHKKRLKDKWKEYLKADAANKQALRDEAEVIMKELSDAEDAYKKLLTKEPDRGYASVLENSNFITAWPIGRIIKQEKAAGKEIRKTTEKGLPKEKDH